MVGRGRGQTDFVISSSLPLSLQSPSVGGCSVKLRAGTGGQVTGSKRQFHRLTGGSFVKSAMSTKQFLFSGCFFPEERNWVTLAVSAVAIKRGIFSIEAFFVGVESGEGG